MSHHFELRLTDVGRAALADGQNRGIRAVEYTKISVGSGAGAGGSADDGRAALRSERDSAAVTGTTAVAGELVLLASITPSADYAVTEVGLWGRIGSSGAERLHAYWTHPTEVFDRALDGGKLIVAGAIAVVASEAQVTVNASPRVTLESQGLLPRWLLPPPHVATADRRLEVSAAAAAAGGTVSVAAGQKLSVAEPSGNGDSGFSRVFATPAWASDDLDANATYYLRAQVDAAGTLALYVQKGDAGDAEPASLKGTPDGGAGGGFASTPWDARIARIVTGAARSVPTVTRYALDAAGSAGVIAWSATSDFPHPSAAWGSDNALYVSVQASGPSHGGAADPTSDADRSHWRPALKISGAATGTPAKDDLLGFADVSAPGKPNRTVEIQKLPGAIAPSGGVATGKKYGLKALAGGAFELARVTGALLMVLAANADTQRGEANRAQIGDAIAVGAGTYTIVAAWSLTGDARHRVRLEKRAGSGSWEKLDSDFGIRSSTSTVVSGGSASGGWLAKESAALAAGEIRIAGYRVDAPGYQWAAGSFLAAIEESG